MSTSSGEFMAGIKNVNMGSVPVQVADVRTEVIEGELLIYHPGQTRAVYLNPQAAVIWGLCDGSRSIAEIANLIEENYPEAKSVAKDDVTATIAELYANNVLVER
jgi:hypothetical protein